MVAPTGGSDPTPPGVLYLAARTEPARAGPPAGAPERPAADAAEISTNAKAPALAEEGIVVVFGLAKGIDVAVHEACIVEGGRTVAVVGTPLDKVYPPEHAELQELIYREHLLVSQFDSGHRTYKSDFVKRNRAMAPLSDGSVIVEASDTSGTLSQAAETQRLGRPLFFMRSDLAMPDLEWPARFAKHGAIALDDVSQILDAIRR